MDYLSMFHFTYNTYTLYMTHYSTYTITNKYLRFDSVITGVYCQYVELNQTSRFKPENLSFVLFIFSLGT
jgi:hypothetical protein